MVPRSDENLTNHVASPNSAGDPLGHKYGGADGDAVAELELRELMIGDESLLGAHRRYLKTPFPHDMRNSPARTRCAVNADGLGFYINGSTNFSDNSAGFGGGAISSSNAEIYINGNNHFSRNSAKNSVGAITAGGAIQASWSDVRIKGNASFLQNSAQGGGAISLIVSSNLSITGSEAGAGDPFGDEGSGLNYTGGVSFIENVALDRGGALYVGDYDLVEVGHARFLSNNAEVGGGVCLSLVVGKSTEFDTCIFESNKAKDGGAVYLYTGTGVDVFTECFFRGNFAKFSGGAIFHTGSLRIFDSTFMANVVGADGPAIMSIGLLLSLSNVSFLENVYLCPAGRYGYTLASNQSTFCSSCFEEVCARCTNVGEGVPNGEDVQIDGTPVCQELPSGVSASSKGTTLETLTLEQDYYRTSICSHDVHKCYNEEACVGGNDAEKYCASGYEGPYCAVCSDGFAPGTAYSCRGCSGGTRGSAIGLAVTMLVIGMPLAALLLSYLGSVVDERADEEVLDTEEVDHSHAEEEAHRDIKILSSRGWKQKCWSCQSVVVNMLPLTAIKIVVTVWQIISQFAAIAGNVYPEIYTKFVSKLNPINLDLDFVLSYSCIVSTDFYDRLLFATITPPLFLLLLAGSYFIGKKRNSSSKFRMDVVRGKHQSAALYLAFLVYSPVSYKVFQTFACDALDDGDTYLRADYGLSCLTSRHSRYEVYALIMVCVYPIGIPAVFAWLLARNRHALVNDDRETVAHLRPLRGIWGSYRPSRYYYEVVECGRRIILTAIAAFVLPNSTAQIAIVLLVAVAFVFLAETLSPFGKEIDTILYRWGNGIIVASVYIALLMKMEVGTDSIKAVSTFSVVLIVANVAMVATVLFQTAFLVLEWRRMKKAAKVLIVEPPVRRTATTSESSTCVRRTAMTSEYAGDDNGTTTSQYSRDPRRATMISEYSRNARRTMAFKYSRNIKGTTTTSKYPRGDRRTTTTSERSRADDRTMLSDYSGDGRRTTTSEYPRDAQAATSGHITDDRRTMITSKYAIDGLRTTTVPDYSRDAGRENERKTGW